MKNVVALMTVLLASYAGGSYAEMVFQKNTDKSIILTLKDDGTATITKILDDGIQTSVVEGQLEGERSSLTIVREDSHVCPSIAVELYHDVRLGRNMFAMVLPRYQQAAAAVHCQNTRAFEGSFARIKTTSED